MPLLSVNAGCLAYGDVPLLDHVDFQIDAGERVDRPAVGVEDGADVAAPQLEPGDADELAGGPVRGAGCRGHASPARVLRSELRLW